MSEPWTISEDEYERRTEQAREACEEATTRVPETDSWGFFAFGDAPGGIGGGIGLLTWVEGPARLVPFLFDHLVFINPGPSSVDPGRVDREVQEIFAGASPDDLRSGRVLGDLNQRLRGFSQVEWVGTFGDLVSAREEFPDRVRSWYRGDEGEGEGEEPIGADEVADFREAIQQYGI